MSRPVVVADVLDLEDPLRESQSRCEASTERSMKEEGQKTLWDILGIPPPENTISQHYSRRVVLLGRPFSGKRTLCRRLRMAAEAQYPQRDAGGASAALNGGADEGDTKRRQLYNPKEGEMDEEETDDITSKVIADPTGRYPSTDVHGIGISHDFVVQRVPLGVSSPIAQNSTETSLRGIRRTTEFYCCDTVGALSIALPSVESLQQAIVLLVVDASDPCSIREQEAKNYEMLVSHVTSVLRASLPQQDKVRHMQWKEERIHFWREELGRLATLRESVAQRSVDSFPAEGKETPTFAPTNADSDKVCALKSILVATKTDILEKLSKTFNINSEKFGLEDENDLKHIIPSDIRDVMLRSNISLLSLVSHYLRYEAITHRSAFLATSTRVNTTAGGEGAAVDGQPTLVHPFYKGVWAYVNYLFDSVATGSAPSTAAVTTSPGAAATPMPSSVPNACSANLFPSSLLPIGVDTTTALLPSVASGSLSDQTAFNVPDVEASLSLAPFPADTPDGPLTSLHQDYLLRHLAGAGSSRRTLYARNSVSNSSNSRSRSKIDDDSKMIWDTA